MQFLVCVECGLNRIPAPIGLSMGTRFTCRCCVDRLLEKSNIEEAKRMRPLLTFICGPERFSEDSGADGWLYRRRRRLLTT